MKATINVKGVLTVSPETEIEAYALKCWGEENSCLGPDRTLFDASKIIIAWGAELPKKEEEF